MMGGMGPFGRIGLATAILFAVSPLLAPGSLGYSALSSTLPFAAILAVVAVGQSLVIQQGGLDLSVPSVMSLSALLATMWSGESAVGLAAILVAIPAGMALIGASTGSIVSGLGVPPIVATLAANALVLGVIQVVSGGYTRDAPRDLTSFAVFKVIGIPMVVWIALLIVAALHILGKSSVLGRRLEAIGTSPSAARAAGLPIRRHVISAYAGSALLAGVAGVMAAGFLRTPALNVGDSYLLAAVTAAVLGGVSLAGGKASFAASGIGALFLAQMEQLILTRGGSSAIQDIFSAAIIAFAAGLQLRLKMSRRNSEKGDSVKQLTPAGPTTLSRS